MKLNLDYYKKDIKYNLSINSEINANILDKIKKVNNTNYDIINNQTSCIEFNNITSSRRNILEWYDFKKTDDVLEIGTEYGVVTEFLCNKFSKVTSISFSKKEAEIVSHKLEKNQNLEIILGSLKDIKLNKKFDYIIMLGMLDNYKYIYGSDINKYFSYLKSLLKKDGVILLATNNKIGTQYLSGSLNEYTAKTINDYNEKKYIQQFSKNEILKILNDNKFQNYKFYYPLPNYKMTNVIFSDEYLPTFNNSKLMYNLNYLEGSSIFLNELNLIKQITKNHDFANFANSFFIEIFNDEYTKTSDIKFVSYNNLRKKEYRLITKMYNDVVIKTLHKKEADKHLVTLKNNIDILNNCNIATLDSYERGKIISKFCKLKTFNRILIEMIRSNKINEFYDYLNVWNKSVLSKLGINQDEDDIRLDNIFLNAKISLTDEEIKEFNFTKNGLFDLVFENAFVDKENKFTFYDQEWYEKNVPIEFILYRGINNLYMYSFDLEEILPKNEILKKFNLNKYVDLFKRLEEYIQNKILDKDMLFICSKAYDFRVNISELKEANKSLKNDKSILNDRVLQLEKYTDELNENIAIINKEKNDLNLKLDAIYNSKGWKLLEKIRKISGRKK